MMPTTTISSIRVNAVWRRLRQAPIRSVKAFAAANASTRSGENFFRHSLFVLRHFGEAVHVCCCKPVMMLMSGVKRASTIVPTITARNTIMIGSSIEVRAATALSTSSS